MTSQRAVVIGVGNEYRHDDGIGPAAIAELDNGELAANVSLMVSDGEPSQLLEAWSGVALTVVIDAILREPGTPGRIARTQWNGLPAGGAGGGSTHGLGIPDAIRLAEALGRTPQRLVVYTVEAGDLSFGLGLSAAVASALPILVRTIQDELALLAVD
jgi:hydrogenase maturation protease